MKNNFFYIFFALIFFSNSLFAENLNIQSKNISIDKSSKLTGVICANDKCALNMTIKIIRTRSAFLIN